MALCHKLQALLIKRGALLIFFSPSFSDSCQSPGDCMVWEVTACTNFRGYKARTIVIMSSELPLAFCLIKLMCLITWSQTGPPQLHHWRARKRCESYALGCTLTICQLGLTPVGDFGATQSWPNIKAPHEGDVTCFAEIFRNTRLGSYQIVSLVTPFIFHYGACFNQHSEGSKTSAHNWMVLQS